MVHVPTSNLKDSETVLAILLLAIPEPNFSAQSCRVAVIATHVVKVSINSFQRGLFSTGCFLLKE